MRRTALLLLIVTASCGAPSRRSMIDDGARSFASGTSFEVPPRWSVHGRDDLRILEDPEHVVRLTVVESRERDLERAIDDAWSRIMDGFSPEPEGPSDAPPPTDGWDARLDRSFDEGDGYVARAVARRFRDTTYVVLVAGEANAVDRRDAQIQQVIGSLHPPEMREESFAGRAPRPIDRARLDAQIAHAREVLGVPGVAVAVLSSGRVVYEHVSGVCALSAAEPITRDTRFLMASVTKPITTMMQAALVDAHTFEWDTPVTAVLPSFALGDEETTRALRMWHMSCACTGMPRQDLEDIFEYANVSAEERLVSMRTMRPTTALGETFQYSNLMVSAGGLIAGHAFAPERPLGEAYIAAVQATVLTPIGMSATTFDEAEVVRGEHARPHAIDIDGHVREMPIEIERSVVPILPAGGAWSTLADMESYLLTELREGVAPNGMRVVSEAGMRERRHARVRTDAHDGYGLGLGVGTQLGLATIHHDGGAFGFGTTIFGLPELGIGIVVLTNVRNGGPAEQLPLNAYVKRAILEMLFDGRALAELSLDYYIETTRRVVEHASATVERDAPAEWFAALAGTYQNDALGTVTITDRTFDAGEWRLTFGRHVGDGTEQIMFLDPPFAGSRVEIEGGNLRIPGQTTYLLERR